MGIGNTTAAAAVICAITGHPPELICGRGTGIDDAGLALKISTVKAALEKNKQAISSKHPWTIVQAVGKTQHPKYIYFKTDTYTYSRNFKQKLITMRCAGGLEIAAMVGAYQYAYDKKVAVIVDGFISGAAALVACKVNPEVQNCLFWSHKSAEQGAGLLLEAVRNTQQPSGSGSSDDNNVMGVVPILDMGLKLGEGTGAVLALPILRSAAAIMSNMAALNDIL